MRPRNVFAAVSAIGLAVAALIVLRGDREEKVASTRGSTTVPRTTSPLPSSIVTTTTTAATIRPSTTITPSTVASTTTIRRQVDLQAAIDSGLVSYRATGGDLQSVRISLTAHEAVEVVVPVGTLFAANGGGVQNMVVRAREVVSLRPDVEVDVDLDAACASMDLDTPYSDDSFTVQGLHSPELVALLELPALRGSTFRVQQFAIWTVTDDPYRGGYVGLGTGPGGAGPTDAELGQIRDFFSAAGLDPAAYRALA